MKNTSTIVGLLLLALGCLEGCGSTAGVIQPEQQWRQLQQRLQVAPADAEAQYRRAILTLIWKNDYRSAEKQLGDVLRLKPRHRRAQMMRVFLHWFHGRYHALTRDALKLIAAAPDAPEAEVALVLLRFAQEVVSDFGPRVSTALQRLVAVSHNPDVGDRANRLLQLLAEQMKDPRALQLTRKHQGTITDWRVTTALGRAPVLDFDRPLAPESDAVLRASYRDRHGKPGATLARNFRSGSVIGHRLTSLGGQLYAESFVYATAPTKTVLRVLSNRPIKVWLGGTAAIVHNSYRSHTGTSAQREVVLHAGWTRVRVKLSSTDHQGWFWLRLVPDTGTLRYSRHAGVEGNAKEPLVGAARSTSGRHFERAWKQDNGDPGALIAVWVLARHWDRFDRETGKRAVRRLQRRFPKSVLATLLEGRDWLVDNTVPQKLAFVRAQRALDRAGERWPNQLWVNYYQGYILRRSGFPKRAIRRFNRCLQENPRFPWTQVQLFYVFVSQKWEREAETALKKLLRLAPGSTAAAVASGFFRQRHRFKDYQRALRLYDRVSSALLTSNVAHHALRQSDDKRAETRFRRLTKLYPHQSANFRELYNLFYRQGQFTKAEHVLNALEALTPASQELGFQRGKLAFWRHGQAAAVAIWQRHLKRHPGHFKLRRLLALLTGDRFPPFSQRRAGEILKRYHQEHLQRPELRDWRRYATVSVLNGRYIRVYQDGSVVMLVHWIRLLQNKRAADRFGEWKPPKGARMLEMRTIKRDGRVLEPELGQKKGDLSFSGLNTGDAIEIAYLITKPRATNLSGYMTTMVFREIDNPAFLLDFVVDTQRGLQLKLYPHNRAPAPQITPLKQADFIGSRYAWRRTRVQPLRAEPFKPALREIYPITDVFVSQPAPWKTLRDNYRSWLTMATAPTLELSELARRLRAGTAEKTLSRVVDYLREHVRQVGSASRFWPRASWITASGKGNRVVVLVALLKLLKLPHRVLLIRPRNAPQISAIPSPGFYYHPLVAVKLGNRWRWIDITSRYAVLGQWSEQYNDAPALCVSGSCDSLQRVPRQTPSREGWFFHFDVRLARNGEIKGVLRAEGIGNSARYLRYGLQRVAKKQARRFFEKWLSLFFDGAQLTTFEILNTKNPRKPLLIRMAFEAPSAFTSSSGTLSMRRFFSRRVSPLWGGGRPLARYVRLPSRTLPLLIAPLREQLVVRLNLPSGTKLDAGPESYRFSNRYGSLSQSLRRDGGVLEFQRRINLGYSRVQPAEYAAFRIFVRKLTVLNRNPLRLLVGGTR